MNYMRDKQPSSPQMYSMDMLSPNRAAAEKISSPLHSVEF